MAIARKYIVLDLDTTPLLGGISFDVSGTEASEPAVVTEAELTDDEVADQRRGGSGRLIAEVMPTRLIEPVARDGDGAVPDGSAWGVVSVGASTSPFTGKGITVAVLDTGIARDHKCFAGIEIVENDFTGEGNGDLDGHGTHCAGTIAGRDVDGLRIGIAPGIERLLIAKVIGQQARSSTAVPDAIIWASQNGAQVISMSLGIDFPQYVSDQIELGMPPAAATSRALSVFADTLGLFNNLAQYVRSQGGVGRSALLVGASGNASDRNAQPPYTIDAEPPGKSDGFISVAALGSMPDGAMFVAPFSNTGAKLSAPGVDVISAAAAGGLTSMSGTSMATPHVAGVAALWSEQLLTRFDRIDIDVLSGNLISSCRPVPGLTFGDGGAGLVRAPD